MHTNDAMARSDRVLVVALAIVMATASAALGSAMTYRPIAPVMRIPASVPAPHNDSDVVLTQLIAEHRCLSQALYYEARGEGRIGEQAVAEVVFHRMNAGNFGHSICAVVYEGSGHPGCQFSFTCNGDLRREKEARAWTESERLAAEILTDQAWRKDSTGGATNYHASSISPDWAPTLEKTGQIG